MKYYRNVNESRWTASIILVTFFFLSLYFITFFFEWLHRKLLEEFFLNYYNTTESVKLVESISMHYLNLYNQDVSVTDRSTLIDIKNFNFTLNHIICNKTQPFLVILIHSAPANLYKRNFIRGTWGKHTSCSITLFLVGSSDYYGNELVQENLKYEDIIQGNFLDGYKNMTYKHVMALKWATYYCSNAKYVLKLDDDVFVHVHTLVSFLKNNPFRKKNIILCDAISNLKVKRSWRSKWRVSPKEYPENEYPSYCAGWAILYSIEVVNLLYQEAQKEPFFWIDDVHITGTLAKKINVTQMSMRSIMLSKQIMRMLLKNME